MRCLFLQVLLEEEKVCVCLKASSQLYKGLSNALTALVQHPRFGAGHKFRVVQVSLQSTCSEIMAKVSGKLASRCVKFIRSFLVNPVCDNPVLLTNEHKNVYQMGTNVKIHIPIDSIIQSI